MMRSYLKIYVSPNKKCLKIIAQYSRSHICYFRFLLFLFDPFFNFIIHIFKKHIFFIKLPYLIYFFLYLFFNQINYELEIWLIINLGRNILNQTQIFSIGRVINLLKLFVFVLNSFFLSQGSKLSIKYFWISSTICDSTALILLCRKSSFVLTLPSVYLLDRHY